MPSKFDRSKTAGWQLLVACLVGLDLLIAGWGLNPGIETSFYDLSATQAKEGRIWIPENVEYDLKFNRFFRFESFSLEINWEDMHHVYLPNLPMIQDLETVNNFDPLVPGYYQDWMTSINADPPGQQILQMMNVNSIVKEDDLGEIKLTSLDYAIQPVRVTGCAAVISPSTISPQLIIENEENLLESIIVISDSQVPCYRNGNGKVEILDKKNGYLSLSVDLDDEGWVFWSQTWYPGWEFRVDGGTRNPSYRVNYLFQGAPVPVNAKQVEFIYRPASVIWGSGISGFSLLLGAALVLINRKRT
jgi:hypothetical protein